MFARPVDEFPVLVKVFFQSEPALDDVDMLMKSLSTFITISPCFFTSSLASASNWSYSFFCSSSKFLLFLPFNGLLFTFSLRILMTRKSNSSLKNFKIFLCACSTSKPFFIQVFILNNLRHTVNGLIIYRILLTSSILSFNDYSIGSFRTVNI